MDKQGKWGKLPDLAEQLYRQLEELHYKDATVSAYRHAIRDLQAYMDENRLCRYSEDVGRQFVGHEERRRTAYMLKFAKTAVLRLNDVLSGRQYTLFHRRARRNVPSALSAPLEEYLLLRRSSGAKETTLSKNRRYLEIFLQGLGSAGTAALAEVGPRGIRAALSALRLAADFATAVKQFLAFAHRGGYAANDYSAIVPRPRARHTVPSAYSPEEVAAVLACIDRVSLIGKRNYAMLLLAARLGLRRSDIVALKPRNIDFRRKVITLAQSKTGEPLELPLLDEVQEALADYIKNARPGFTVHEEVFLGHMAPHAPLARDALTAVARKCFGLAGIDPRGRRQGPHALRASLATGMLAEGAPYGVIAKVLGHAGESALRSYVEIDIEQLRACALEVPAPSGAFALRIADEAGWSR